MHRIYFESRTVVVCRPDHPVLQDPNAVILTAAGEESLQIPDFFRRHPSVHLLCLPDTDPEKRYAALCSRHEEIWAAGGLVRNPAGKYLLIYRNGCWDLPKGKQEAGEDLRTTALREVEEECGLHGLIAEAEICTTDHTYILNGKQVLKHTRWYAMTTADEPQPVPQLEENITRAEWVEADCLPERIRESYLSVRDVFRNILPVSAGL